jgi:hypothetical protein
MLSSHEVIVDRNIEVQYDFVGGRVIIPIRTVTLAGTGTAVVGSEVATLTTTEHAMASSGILRDVIVVSTPFVDG